MRIAQHPCIQCSISEVRMETPQEPETNVDSVLPTDILDSSGCGTETVDLPSDFFDEFNKEEFIEGLSIIDTWDDGVSKSDKRNVAQQSTVESDIFQFPLNATDTNIEKKEAYSKPPSSRLDDFIKPGSRRDPNKTNQAIKKDKEEKVKEFLAKSLESTDDLRPPGTELDDYFEDNKPMKKEKTPILHASPRPLSPAPRPDQPPRDSPKLSLRSRDSPSRGSHRQLRLSPRRSPRRHSPSRRSDLRQHSPQRNYKPSWGLGGCVGNMYRSNRRFSPRRSPRRSPARRSPARRSPARRSPARRSPARRSPARRSPARRSPGRRSPARRSPLRRSPRRSPRRTPTRRSSPRRSPQRQRRSRSRSPYKRSNNSRRSRSRSAASMKQPDKFLYPTDEPSSPYSSNPGMSSPYVAPGSYPAPAPSLFPPPIVPNYQYGAQYTGGFNSSNPYEYSPGPPPPESISNLMSGSVPPLNSVPIPMASVPQAPNPVPAPVMVPAPNMVSPSLPPVTNQVNAPTPYDALAKLAAEGKISREDYLKLAPNKGVSSGLENNQRVTVLTRCTEAISRLLKLHLPSHLVLHNSLLDSRRDAKYIAPKFCSPLKRQAPVEFEFTRVNAAVAHQNKHLVDSIIASLPEVEKIVSRPKKKTPKNTKDAAVQTSKPFCEVCEIRESTKSYDASTSVDAAHFCSSVHTQVVEQELMSSKAVFNPSGSAGDGTMSIAHLTPAQLVSQLQARAKTLQKTDPAPNQYRGGSSNNYDYDYDSRSGQQYQNYKNYRY